MTQLTEADRARISTPASPPVMTPKRSLTGVLTDPRVRLGAGAAVLLITALAARHDRVGPREAAAFRR